MLSAWLYLLPRGSSRGSMALRASKLNQRLELRGIKGQDGIFKALTQPNLTPGSPRGSTLQCHLFFIYPTPGGTHGLNDIMHPQHQILRILRRLVPVSRLRLGRARHTFGTTETASQTR